MNIYVYGDESGVLDKAHNEVFVFGGLIFLDRTAKNLMNRTFLQAEERIRQTRPTPFRGRELKASRLSDKDKSALLGTTDRCIRYVFFIDQEKVNDGFFSHKKLSQRYLDYVFKTGLKSVFTDLINQGAIDPAGVENLHIYFDRHDTATNEHYELREAIEQDFKYGTCDFGQNSVEPPVFGGMSGVVNLTFRDSRKDALIRASDIISNLSWHAARQGDFGRLGAKAHLVRFP